jgi:hypothetical protein
MELTQENILKVAKWLVNDILPRAKEINELKKELDVLLDTKISLNIPTNIDVYVDIDFEKPRVSHYLSTIDGLKCEETASKYDRIRVSIHGGGIEVSFIDKSRNDVISSTYINKLEKLLDVMCDLNDEDLNRIIEEFEKKEARLKETVEKLKQVITMLRMIL